MSADHVPASITTLTTMTGTTRATTRADTSVTAIPITTALAASTATPSFRNAAVPSPRRLALLAAAIAERGPSAHESQLVALGRTARRHLGARAAIDVMIDRTAEPVVRQRAFAVVTSALLAATRRGEHECGGHRPDGERRTPGVARRPANHR